MQADKVKNMRVENHRARNSEVSYSDVAYFALSVFHALTPTHTIIKLFPSLCIAMLPHDFRLDAIIDEVN